MINNVLFQRCILVCSGLVFLAVGAFSFARQEMETMGCMCLFTAVFLLLWALRLQTTRIMSAATFGLLIGLSLCVTSLIGLGAWLEADWFADPGPYAPNAWFGYDSKHFLGLLHLTVAAPLGVSLSIASLHVLCRSWNPRTAARYNALRFGFGLALMSLAGAGTWWAWIMGRCLGAFCLNPSVWTPAPVSTQPTAGYGWMATVGFTAFFSLLPLGCILCVTSARSLASRYRAQVQATTQVSTRRQFVASPFKMYRTALDVNEPLRPTGWHVFWFLLQSAIALIFLVAFAIVSMYMPNTWEQFSADRIASTAVWRLSLNYNLCNNDFAQYACSDYPWAYFGAWNVSFNAGWWVLKLYPSSVFWFSYFILMLLGAAVLTASGRKSDWLTRPRMWNLRFTTLRMSIVQATGLFVTTAMLSLFAMYWFHDHNFDGLGGPNAVGLAPSERYARAFGQMAVAMMGLLVFPASRNSVLHTTLGTSWEGFLWVHRTLGYGMLACTVAHVVAWYVKFSELSLFPRAAFSVPMVISTNKDNFTVPLTTVTTFLLLVCMGLLALEPVRRRAFEVFYYAHLVAAYTSIPAVLWHAAAGWEYLLPGLTVWFVDRLLRHIRSSRTAVVTEASVCPDGVVLIRFTQPELEVRPGQYVFVHVAEVAALEWHPFTVSSVDNEKHSFTVHIKAMTPQPLPFVPWLSPSATWTQRLFRAVSNNVPITLSVDGPCGPQHDISHFKKIIIIAGGIGITPCAALVDHLRGNLRLLDLQLHWTLREPALALAFRHQLQHGDNPRYQGVLYATRPTEETLVQQLPLPVSLGRPNLDKIFDAAVDPLDVDPSSTFVFVCGPPAMVETCAQLALARGFSFHEETFFL